MLSNKEAAAARSSHTATKGSPYSPQLEKSPSNSKDPAKPKNQAVENVYSIRIYGDNVFKNLGINQITIWGFTAIGSKELKFPS